MSCIYKSSWTRSVSTATRQLLRPQWSPAGMKEVSMGNNSPFNSLFQTLMYRTVFWTLWERERVGWFGRTALKHVQYHIWNESPVQDRCMILDTWGWCTGTTQRDGTGREEDSGWGTCVYLWQIHVDIWQNQYNIVKFKNKIKKKNDCQWPDVGRRLMTKEY